MLSGSYLCAHNGSFSQSGGKPIAFTSTFEYFASNALKRDLKVFAEAWSKLATSGVVQTDLETENAIRSDFKLPSVTAKEAPQGDNTQGVVQ